MYVITPNNVKLVSSFDPFPAWSVGKLEVLVDLAHQVKLWIVKAQQVGHFYSLRTQGLNPQSTSLSLDSLPLNHWVSVRLTWGIF